MIRERRGKVFEDVRGLDLYDDQGTRMGGIRFNNEAVYQVIVTTNQERLMIHVLHPSTGKKYHEFSGPSPEEG